MTRSRPRRRWMPVAALATLALVLAGCGGTKNEHAGAGKGAVPPPQSAEELKAAAEKEGSLVWYTTFSSSDIDPFVKEFNKAYPNIKIEPVRLSADQLPPRILTEQRGGKYAADVVSGDVTQTSQLVHNGALTAYDPPDVPALPAGLDLEKGYRSVVYTVTTVIAFNPSMLKKNNVAPPASWQDLTKPEWKGHFSVDPTAINWYDSMVASMGHDKALELMQALGKNSPRLVESHTQALTQVQSGEPWATATAYGYAAAKLKKKTPDQVDFVNPNPLPVSLTPILMATKAPHPNAAKLFLAWIESKEGQKAVVDITNHTSLRDDVGNDPTVWDPAKWKPAWAGAGLTEEQYNKYVQEYSKALGAP